MTLSYGEAVLLLRKLKWVQHEIILIPSKHALVIESRGQGWEGAASLVAGSVALFRFFPAPLPHSLCTTHPPLLHVTMSYFFQSAL